MASLATGALGPLLGGLTGLIGGLIPHNVNSNFNQTQNQTQSSSSNSSTSPVLSALQNQLSTLFGDQAINQANTPVNLNGYTAGGLQQINQGQNAATSALNNSLASRGLGFSQAAGNANTQNTLSGISQGNNFLNSIPLLQRQIQQQNIQQLTGAFSALPTAVSSSNNSNQTGTTSSSGSGTNVQNTGAFGGIAGALSGATAGLAASYPNLLSGNGGSSGGSGAQGGTGITVGPYDPNPNSGGGAPNGYNPDNDYENSPW